MEAYNLINGNIITLNPLLQMADTLTISNGKIENINQTNRTYKTLDLNGHTVIPGFIDAHFHLKNFGKRLDMLNLKGSQSLDEIAQKIESKLNSLGKITAAATTGPARGPLPASSIPIILLYPLDL